MQQTAQEIEVITRVQQLRNHLGLTQKEFGDKIGLDKTTISAIEKGKRSLTPGNAHLIGSKISGVNPGWLLKGEGSMFLHRPDAQGSPVGLLGLTDAEMGNVEMAAREPLGMERTESDWRRENAVLRAQNLALTEKVLALLDRLDKD